MKTHRALFVADARRGGPDRLRQGAGHQVFVHGGRAGDVAECDLHRNDREQGRHEGRRGYQWLGDRNFHGETSVKKLTLVACVLSVVSGFSGTVSAQQPPDGAAVYKAACAQCHDQPEGRTPSREALKDRTPEAVLQSLNGGSMALQALTLSVAEKRAVAEYVAGKPIGSASDTAGLCSATSGGAADSTRRPQPLASIEGWNGWGIDLSTAGISQPGLTAADVPNLKLKWRLDSPVAHRRTVSPPSSGVACSSAAIRVSSICWTPTRGASTGPSKQTVASGRRQASGR